MQIRELYFFEDTFKKFLPEFFDGMLQQLKLKVVSIWILFSLISTMNPEEQKQVDTLRAKRTSRCSGCRYQFTEHNFGPVGPYCRFSRKCVSRESGGQSTFGTQIQSSSCR